MKSKQVKVITSLFLGTAMVFGGMIPTVTAKTMESSKIQYNVVDEESPMSIWNAQEGLNQNEKNPYIKGSIAIYNGKVYECKRFHYPQLGWNPSEARMFWKSVGVVPEWYADETHVESSKVPYQKGDIVSYNSNIYKCKRFHYAQPGWNPCEAPMFWELVK
ncbi:carbohydrate-binding protein [Clostridium ihumii]|uniref:carbohydrate-binding protein n=1 Tax=Clostridium ihumii TaxID=1470356 RepID=UPI00058D7540|nr:carbohydrate-binding protein [Clostridium ihumii]